MNIWARDIWPARSQMKPGEQMMKPEEHMKPGAMMGPDGMMGPAVHAPATTTPSTPRP